MDKSKPKVIKASARQKIRSNGRVSHKGSMGVRLSPSPIHYVVVIVKKDYLCVAQVISHLRQCRRESNAPTCSGKEGEGAGWRGEPLSNT